MGLVSFRDWKNNTAFRASSSFEMNSGFPSFLQKSPKGPHYPGEMMV